MTREIQIYEGSPRRSRQTALAAPPRRVRPWLLMALGGAGLLGLIIWWLNRRKSMSPQDPKNPMPTLTATPIVEQPPQIITLDQFRKIMPGLPFSDADRYLPYLNDAMSKAGSIIGPRHDPAASIVTPLAVAAFLANVKLESGDLRYLSEIWGPSMAQLRYESSIPRLGNNQPGDGYKYRGRGALQLTGRGAYREAGAALGLPLEENPDLVATEPAAIFGTAAWHWAKLKLTPWAEAGNFDAVVRGINCGSPTSSKCNPYHLDKRREYYQKAKAVLGVA